MTTVALTIRLYLPDNVAKSLASAPKSLRFTLQAYNSIVQTRKLQRDLAFPMTAFTKLARADGSVTWLLVQDVTFNLTGAFPVIGAVSVDGRSVSFTDSNSAAKFTTLEPPNGLQSTVPKTGLYTLPEPSILQPVPQPQKDDDSPPPATQVVRGRNIIFEWSVSSDSTVVCISRQVNQATNGWNVPHARKQVCPPGQHPFKSTQGFSVQGSGREFTVKTRNPCTGGSTLMAGDIQL